jgi:hypothetical protein
MKIKLLGIEMKTGQGITLADMFEAISLYGGQPGGCGRAQQIYICG